MNILLSGSRAFGAAVFELIRAAGHQVVTVASPADGRRTLTGRDRLRDAAERAGVRWLDASALTASAVPADTDLIVCAHSHAFVGRPTRLAARLGAIGYHPSLLPLHRGRDAVEWAIRMRERVTGGSVYWLSDGIDAGDIAAQEHVFIREDDTARSLWERELFPLGLLLFRTVIDDLSNGVMVRIPQQQSVATWEPSIGRAPVFRPELPLLGEPAGFTVQTVGRPSLSSPR